MRERPSPLKRPSFYPWGKRLESVRGSQSSNASRPSGLGAKRKAEEGIEVVDLRGSDDSSAEIADIELVTPVNPKSRRLSPSRGIFSSETPEKGDCTLRKVDEVILELKSAQKLVKDALKEEPQRKPKSQRMLIRHVPERTPGKVGKFESRLTKLTKRVNRREEIDEYSPPPSPAEKKSIRRSSNTSRGTQSLKEFLVKQSPEVSPKKISEKGELQSSHWQSPLSSTSPCRATLENSLSGAPKGPRGPRGPLGLPRLKSGLKSPQARAPKTRQRNPPPANQSVLTKIREQQTRGAYATRLAAVHSQSAMNVEYIESNGKTIEVISIDSDEPIKKMSSEDVPEVILSDGSEVEGESTPNGGSAGLEKLVESLTIDSDLLTPLSDSEKGVLSTAMSSKASKDEVLSVIKEANITLTREDFVRLQGERWLHDEIINSYVAMLNRRNSERYESNTRRNGYPRVHCFNTFFFAKLFSARDKYDYESVRRWTKKAKVDILQRDLVLVPVNLGNKHWVCAYVDMKNKVLVYLDSMHGKDYGRVLENLRKWVSDEVKDKHGDEAAKKLKMDGWKEVSNRKIAKQGDAGSCGVFQTVYLDCLERSLPLNSFRQKDIPLLRKRIALCLLKGELPV
ncbi:hypothetical protein NDN08_002612 [Rhodosorus marinus]|uniref:Ubiquitin-like protease family profile domain-containing protein n=1 Tax=Rhodosorus marinus TaxID=101924 RepID=A0AAV8UYA1_9RHOD|nr:hypothetical protein NDN08_002612 [Rhodosorus marinus]